MPKQPTKSAKAETGLKIDFVDVTLINYAYEIREDTRPELASKLAGISRADIPWLCLVPSTGATFVLRDTESGEPIKASYLNLQRVKDTIMTQFTTNPDMVRTSREGIDPDLIKRIKNAGGYTVFTLFTNVPVVTG